MRIDVCSRAESDLVSLVVFKFSKTPEKEAHINGGGLVGLLGPY